jgi:hypothetical protein
MADLEADTCLNLMANLSQRLIDRSGQVAEEIISQGVTGAQELAERLLPRIAYQCQRMLREL